VTDRELMQQALECLLDWEEESCGNGWSIKDQQTVDAIRARLADEMPIKIFGPNLEEILNAAGFYRIKEKNADQ
jgi:hypothetical protein